MALRRLANIGTALALAASISLTGCWGSFTLTGKLYDWNDGVSGEKFVKWLVFLGLVIIPVYEISLIVDALIFNTVEFYTGSNPVARVERRGNTAVAITDSGDEYEVVPESPTEAGIYRDGDRVGSAVVTDDGSVRVLDAGGGVVKILSSSPPPNQPSQPMQQF